MKPAAICVFLASFMPARFALAATIEEETQSALGDYASGKFDEAVARIEVAILAAPDAKPSARAQAYRALAAAEAARRNMAAARKAIALAVRLDPKITFDPRRFPRSVVDLLREARDALRGTVVIICNRPTARVEVDGVTKGRCGVTIEVPLGRHRVVVVAEAESPRAQDVDVDRADRHEVVVTFETPRAILPKEKEKPVAIAVTPVSPGPPVAPSSVAEARTGPPSTEPLSKARRIAAWTMIGVGAATFIAGAIMRGIVGTQEEEISAPRLDGNYRLTDFEVVEDRARASLVMVVSGGVVATAGTLLLLIRGKSSASSAARGFELGLASPAGARTVGTGVTARWRF